jgi:hypothetical protein
MEASIVQPRATSLIFVRPSPTVVAAALLVLLALSSCGHDGKQAGSDAPASAADPRGVVHRYFAALAHGDGRTVCGLMTAAGREALRQLPEGETAGTCERAVVVLARDSVPVRRAQLRDLRVSGRTATVTVTSKDPPYESGVLLRRDGGGWKIAYPPGFESRFDSPPGIKPHEDEHQKGR